MKEIIDNINEIKYIEHTIIKDNDHMIIFRIKKFSINNYSCVMVYSSRFKRIGFSNSLVNKYNSLNTDEKNQVKSYIENKFNIVVESVLIC